MRTTIPALSLFSFLSLAPAVHAAKPTTPIVAAAAASHIDLEIAEVAKDGGRKALVLSLTLPDGGRGGAAELRTRVNQGEHGEAVEYFAKVVPEDTAAGIRYLIELRRAGEGPARSFDMRVDVARVLRPGVAVQIGRVSRPDGSAQVVTATVR